MPFEPRFGPAARAYRTFRPDYPEELFRCILAAVPEHRRRRVIDLGAGTGKSAGPLCTLFEEVHAVEPDSEMAALLAGIAPNLTVHNITAEDHAAESASADLVTAGTSLHWMDAPRVVQCAARWLRPGGVLAAYSYRIPTAGPQVQRIVEGELNAHWKAYRHARLDEKFYVQHAVLSSREFHDFESHSIEYVVPLGPAEFTGFWRSTSYGNAYARTLADPETYWQDLESAFREAQPEGMIPVDFSLYLILARKP